MHVPSMFVYCKLHWHTPFEHVESVSVQCKDAEQRPPGVPSVVIGKENFLTVVIYLIL